VYNTGTRVCTVSSAGTVTESERGKYILKMFENSIEKEYLDLRGMK
jgi:hypothetical protein